VDLEGRLVLKSGNDSENPPPDIFSLKNVGFFYGGQSVLRGLSLNFRAEESVVLLGPNGSGKSTLLKLLAGLIYPREGQIFAFGHHLTENLLARDQFGIFFRSSVGMVFQNSEAQLFNPTVRDEIAFGPLQISATEQVVWEHVAATMNKFGIEALCERSPFALSGGEKKKVALASVLVMDPTVLLLDEPTAGLDPRSTKALTTQLQELRTRNKTLITTTHDLDLAAKLAHRIIVLGENKTVLADGAPQEILNNLELLSAANLK
jgi:cobalt/nickel transport system ATP-binding protein